MKQWWLGIGTLLVGSWAIASEAPWGKSHQAAFLSSLEPVRFYPAIELDEDLVTQLITAEPTQTIEIPVLTPWQHVETYQSPELEPFDVRAEGSETLVLVNGERQSSASEPRKKFYRLTNTELDLVLSVDPTDHSVRGWARDAGQRFAVELNDGRMALAPMERPPGAERTCELAHGKFADIDHSSLSRPASMPSLGNAVANSSHMYEAIVAVDTDNEWLWEKFDNNAAAAEAWVDDSFAAMNVFFERDLDLRLLRGDLILRIDTTPAGPEGPDFNADPYSELGDVLGEFGGHWMDTADLRNRAGAFVSLLSGRGFSAQNPTISPGSFSGVAWVDAYCRRTRGFGNFGSFNVNRIGANLGVGFVSGGWGHELGHNLGSRHTHCERLAPGNNFVDECSTDGNNCFSGAASCPAEGTGTIMSYCNPSLYEGPGSCNDRNEFHPLIIGKLSTIIQSEAPSCILPAGSQGEEPIFADSFES